ncbi:MAG: hypothetical protein Fur0018_25890 [Anaerolineales bacterium]
MSESVETLGCELPADGWVWLRHGRGRVRILPGEGRAVSLTAESPAGLHWQMTTDPAGEIRIRSLPDDLAHPPAADCTLTLPAESRLRVYLVDGTLHLENVTGRARLETVSADIFLREASGAWHVKTVSGSVEGCALHGGLFMQTVSGNVHLLACRITNMQGHMLNGDLMLETPILDGPYTLQTIAGDVVLRLPAETHCDLDFRTISGRLEIAHSGVYFPRRGTHRQVMLGDGGPQVTVKSLSGSLWVMGNVDGGR